MKMKFTPFAAPDRLLRGIAWCTKCGGKQKISVELCMKNGWPKCCGYTMTIDSPEERQALDKEPRDAR